MAYPRSLASMGSGCLQVVQDRSGFGSQPIDVGLGGLNAAIGSVDFEKNGTNLAF